MEAKDLRIGNIVNRLFEGSTPEAIIVDTRILWMMQKPDGHFTFEAIPLTEKILLKCGAKELDNSEELENHNHFKVGGSEMYVCADNGNGYANEGKALLLVRGIPYTSYPCKHLHQLQNLYFALTSQELQINL